WLGVVGHGHAQGNQEGLQGVEAGTRGGWVDLSGLDFGDDVADSADDIFRCAKPAAARAARWGGGALGFFGVHQSQADQEGGSEVGTVVVGACVVGEGRNGNSDRIFFGVHRGGGG